MVMKEVISYSLGHVLYFYLINMTSDIDEERMVQLPFRLKKLKASIAPRLSVKSFHPFARR